jgi:hypothetical protein
MSLPTRLQAGDQRGALFRARLPIEMNRVGRMFRSILQAQRRGWIEWRGLRNMSAPFALR